MNYETKRAWPRIFLDRKDISNAWILKSSYECIQAHQNEEVQITLSGIVINNAAIDYKSILSFYYFDDH